MIRIRPDGKWIYICNYCGLILEKKNGKYDAYIMKRSVAIHPQCFIECQSQPKVRAQLNLVRKQLKFLIQVYKEHSKRYNPV